MERISNERDTYVLRLIEDIKAKEKDLGKKPTFNAKTTCIFTFNNNKVNIHTLDMNKVNFYLVYFNSFYLSAKDLNIDPTTVIYEDFSIDDWICDLHQRASILEWTQKSNQCTELKNQLDKLLSEDKQKELQLNSIADLIKGI